VVGSAVNENSLNEKKRLFTFVVFCFLYDGDVLWLLGGVDARRKCHTQRYVGVVGAAFDENSLRGAHMGGAVRVTGALCA